MNSNKYPVENYVPYNPDRYLPEHGFGHSLGYTLDKHAYEKIINNPEYHFENSYITNFDLIHHECRGDKLEHDRKYYQTIYKNKIDEEIKRNDLRDCFISKAVDSERKDVFLKKDVLTEYVSRMELKEKFKEKGIFLSSMERRAFNKKKKKYTDECKSLPF